ncbi:MAG: glycerate kinase [Bacillota bacterium]|nr:glycerate kinase [Bacillota bacterium]
MKVLVLIDSFKGTLSSSRLGKIVTEELGKKGIRAEYFPISDGGDGFLETIVEAIKTEPVLISAVDPLGRPLYTYFLSDNENAAAYLEMAKTSGLNLLKKEERDPLQTSTHGLGRAILTAIDSGAREIIVGLGGSATNDGGAGMLEAMGVRFYNASGEALSGLCGGKLGEIAAIDAGDFYRNIAGVSFLALSDVTNPLLGPEGAAQVFSAQKGADESARAKLEAGMANYAAVVEKETGGAYRDLPGAGAAGGLGFAFYAFFNADCQSGIKYLLDRYGFSVLAEQYDYIITGEGKIDGQSLRGKVISEVIRQAEGKNVILVCAINELDHREIEELGVLKLYKIVGDIASEEESLSQPEKYFRRLIATVAIDLTGEEK